MNKNLGKQLKARYFFVWHKQKKVKGRDREKKLRSSEIQNF